MQCTQCGKTITDQSIFCSFCGRKLLPETVEDVGRRVSLLEQAEEKRKGLDQKYLETETAERIATRLMSWAKLFAGFVAIPLALAAIFLGIYLHRNISDAHDLSETIHGTIQQSVDSAKSQADAANKKANEAVQTAKAIAYDLDSTKLKLKTLNDSIDKSQSHVTTLETDISKSKSRVDSLDENILQDNKKVQQFSQKVTAVMQDRNAVSVGEHYPVFGEHLVRGPRGEYLDIKNKKPADIYVAVLIQMRTTSPDPRLQPDVANFMTVLQNDAYTIFFGTVYLSARANSAEQELTAFDDNSCLYFGHLPSPQTPCILSITPSHPNEQIAIQKAALAVQPIAADHIKQIDFAQLDALRKELVEKSGMDFVVIFDGAPSQH